MSSKKKRGRNVGWDCSVCTYKNTAEAFKCAMCDIRKGTSTRKPRLNSTIVEQQETVQRFVQKQQLEALALAQKEAKLKNADSTRTDSRSEEATPTPSLGETVETPSTSTGGSWKRPKRDRSSESLDVRPDSVESPHPASPVNLNPTRSPTPNSVASGSRLISAPHPPSAEKTSVTPPPCKRPKLSCQADTNGFVGDSAPADPQSPSASATSIASPPTSNQKKKIRPPSKADPSPSPSAAHRTTPTAVGPPKSRLKNIDKNSARNLAVTVDGLTVVITDYKAKPPRMRPPKPPAPVVLADDCNKEESRVVEELSKLDDRQPNEVKLEIIADEIKVAEETNVVQQMLTECQPQPQPTAQ